MRGTMVKKIRKEVNSQVRTEAYEVLNSIHQEKLFTRIKYAFKLIFKFKLGERLNNGRI